MEDFKIFQDYNNKNIKDNVDNLIDYKTTKESFEKEIQDRVDELLKVDKDFNKFQYFDDYNVMFNNYYFNIKIDTNIDDLSGIYTYYNLEVKDGEYYKLIYVKEFYILSLKFRYMNNGLIVDILNSKDNSQSFMKKFEDLSQVNSDDFNLTIINSIDKLPKNNESMKGGSLNSQESDRSGRSNMSGNYFGNNFQDQVNSTQENTSSSPEYGEIRNSRSNNNGGLEQFGMNIDVLNEEFRMSGAENTNDLYTFFHDYYKVTNDSNIKEDTEINFIYCVVPKLDSYGEPNYDSWLREINGDTNINKLIGENGSSKYFYVFKKKQDDKYILRVEYLEDLFIAEEPIFKSVDYGVEDKINFNEHWEYKTELDDKRFKYIKLSNFKISKESEPMDLVFCNMLKDKVVNQEFETGLFNYTTDIFYNNNKYILTLKIEQSIYENINFKLYCSLNSNESTSDNILEIYESTYKRASESHANFPESIDNLLKLVHTPTDNDEISLDLDFNNLCNASFIDKNEYHRVITDNFDVYKVLKYFYIPELSYKFSNDIETFDLFFDIEHFSKIESGFSQKSMCNGVIFNLVLFNIDSDNVKFFLYYINKKNPEAQELRKLLYSSEPILKSLLFSVPSPRTFTLLKNNRITNSDTLKDSLSIEICDYKTSLDKSKNRDFNQVTEKSIIINFEKKDREIILTRSLNVNLNRYNNKVYYESEPDEGFKYFLIYSKENKWVLFRIKTQSFETLIVGMETRTDFFDKYKTTDDCLIMYESKNINRQIADYLDIYKQEGDLQKDIMVKHDMLYYSSIDDECLDTLLINLYVKYEDEMTDYNSGSNTEITVNPLEDYHDYSKNIFVKGLISSENQEINDGRCVNFKMHVYNLDRDTNRDINNLLKLYNNKPVYISHITSLDEEPFYLYLFVNKDTDGKLKWMIADLKSNDIFTFTALDEYSILYKGNNDNYKELTNNNFMERSDLYDPEPSLLISFNNMFLEENTNSQYSHGSDRSYNDYEEQWDPDQVLLEYSSDIFSLKTENMIELLGLSKDKDNPRLNKIKLELDSKEKTYHVIGGKKYYYFSGPVEFPDQYVFKTREYGREGKKYSLYLFKQVISSEDNDFKYVVTKGNDNNYMDGEVLFSGNLNVPLNKINNFSKKNISNVKKTQSKRKSGKKKSKKNKPMIEYVSFYTIYQNVMTKQYLERVFNVKNVKKLKDSNISDIVKYLLLQTSIGRIHYEGMTGIDEGGLRPKFFEQLISELKNNIMMKLSKRHPTESCNDVMVLKPFLKNKNLEELENKFNLTKQEIYRLYAAILVRLIVIDNGAVQNKLISFNFNLCHYLIHRLISDEPLDWKTMFALQKLDSYNAYENNIKNLFEKTNDFYEYAPMTNDNKERLLNQKKKPRKKKEKISKKVHSLLGLDAYYTSSGSNSNSDDDFESGIGGKHKFAYIYLRIVDYYEQNLLEEIFNFTVGFRHALTLSRIYGVLVDPISYNKSYYSNSIDIKAITIGEFINLMVDDEINLDKFKERIRYNEKPRDMDNTEADKYKDMLIDFLKKYQEKDQLVMKNLFKFWFSVPSIPDDTIRLAIQRKNNDNPLIAAHTCFNELVIYDYDNLEQMEERIIYALYNQEEGYSEVVIQNEEEIQGGNRKTKKKNLNKYTNFNNKSKKLRKYYVI